MEPTAPTPQVPNPPVQPSIQPQITTASSSNNKKVLIVVLAIVLLLVISGVVVYILSQNSAILPNSVKQAVNQVVPPQPKNTASDTSNQQLDQDINTTSADLNAFDTDLSSVNQTYNDQPGDLSE